MIFAGYMFCFTSNNYTSPDGNHTNLLSIQVQLDNGDQKKFKLGRHNKNLAYKLLMADRLMIHCENGENSKV